MKKKKPAQFHFICLPNMFRFVSVVFLFSISTRFGAWSSPDEEIFSESNVEFLSKALESSAIPSFPIEVIIKFKSVIEVFWVSIRESWDAPAQVIRRFTKSIKKPVNPARYQGINYLEYPKLLSMDAS